MADENTPIFQIQRVYLKESSLEQPNSPGILLVQEQPTVDIQPVGSLLTRTTQSGPSNCRSARTSTIR